MNIPYPLFKEFGKSIADNGLQSPFPKGIAESIDRNCEMTPWNWRFPVILFTLTQVSFYVQEEKDMTYTLAIANSNTSVPIKLGVLKGKGIFADP